MFFERKIVIDILTHYIKHVFWVPKRTVSYRHFFWLPELYILVEK